MRSVRGRSIGIIFVSIPLNPEPSLFLDFVHTESYLYTNTTITSAHIIDPIDPIE